jgi:teichoic acid transport system permease protein
MKLILSVLCEQKENIYLIKRLSSYEVKNKNRNNILGSLWEIINPLIQLLIYWFVFETVRGASSVDIYDGKSVPFIYWLIAGFILWIFFYKATIDGSSSIYSRIRILSKMSFPMSIIPAIAISPYLYIHLILVGVVMVLFNIGGYFISIYYLQFIYLIPSTLLFLFSLSLITSTLSTIVRDVHMLLSAVLRMFLYISPVLWEIGKISEPWSTIAKLNPLYYLIEGYRSAFFGTEWYLIVHWQYTLYFWLVVFALLLIGSKIHLKFRRHFIDFL